MFCLRKEHQPHLERKICRVKRAKLSIDERRVPLEVIEINRGVSVCQLQLCLLGRVAPRPAVARYPEIEIARALLRMIPMVEVQERSQLILGQSGLDQGCSQPRLIERIKARFTQLEQARFVLTVPDDHRDASRN